jgi:hypothetical protein
LLKTKKVKREEIISSLLTFFVNKGKFDIQITIKEKLEILILIYLILVNQDICGKIKPISDVGRLMHDVGQ